MSRHWCLYVRNPLSSEKCAQTWLVVTWKAKTPPRMWGRQDRAKSAHTWWRNTPTHVGKTRHPSARRPAAGKHPHACGGRHVIALARTPGGRNTPTRVGKTWCDCRILTMHEKHPHACGEDDNPVRLWLCTIETPPRVWGRRWSPLEQGADDGNTPTRVGKTYFGSNKRHADQKHPHACGEDIAKDEGDKKEPETPPRVWGRRFVCRSYTATHRNTPTCVGKTPAYCV